MSKSRSQLKSRPQTEHPAAGTSYQPSSRSLPSTQTETVIEQASSQEPPQHPPRHPTPPPPVLLAAPPVAPSAAPEGFALPAPNSSEWETFDLPPPPATPST